MCAKKLSELLHWRVAVHTQSKLLLCRLFYIFLPIPCTLWRRVRTDMQINAFLYLLKMARIALKYTTICKRYRVGHAIAFLHETQTRQKKFLLVEMVWLTTKPFRCHAYFLFIVLPHTSTWEWKFNKALMGNYLSDLYSSNQLLNQFLIGLIFRLPLRAVRTCISSSWYGY